MQKSQIWWSTLAAALGFPFTTITLRMQWQCFCVRLQCWKGRKKVKVDQFGTITMEPGESPSALTHSTPAAKDGVALKDGGARRTLETGSRRDVRDGKGRYDLLQFRAIHLLSRQLEEGAKKYGDRNWEKGQPLSWYLDSGLRHMCNFAAGKRDERHEIGALWNMASLIETIELIREGKLPRELDDIGALSDE